MIRRPKIVVQHNHVHYHYASAGVTPEELVTLRLLVEYAEMAGEVFEQDLTDMVQSASETLARMEESP